MLEPLLANAIAAITPGRYAVGVSGGADSVALLHLLRHCRPDLYLHVVHLDHQTRGEQSAGDAELVRQLAADWGLAHTIRRRDEVEPLLEERPHNPSAFYRALRQRLYSEAAQQDRLDAVLLAHHADDRAETVLHRLLRGSRMPTGIPRESMLHGLRVIHPLLDIPRSVLRQYLASAGQTWREDASNASEKYARNRLRRLLAARPELTEDLLRLDEALSGLGRWLSTHSPSLPAQFPAAVLAGLPLPLAEESARQWLLRAGIPHEGLTASAVSRLIAMAADAASPPRQQFPGHRLVRRRKGMVFVDA